MKIAVLIKQVPKGDAVMDKKTGLLVRTSQVKTNPYDYFALETALILKDKYSASVDVFSMAPICDFNEFFALNVDNCYHICDRAFAGADVFASSYALSSAIKKMGDYSLILCGRQTTDGDTSAIGSEIAEWLNIPSVMYAKQIIELTCDYVIIDRELTSTIERIKVKLPCVICVDKDSVTPRLPSLRGKLLAKNKQCKVITLNDLADNNKDNYGQSGSKTKVVKVYEETPLSKGVFIDGNTDDFVDFINKQVQQTKKLKDNK